MTTIGPFGQWVDTRADEPDEPDESPLSYRVAVDLLAAQLAAQADTSTPAIPAAPAAAPQKEEP